MLEVLQFYVSGFWVWLGITMGLYVSGFWLWLAIQALKALPSTPKQREEK